jgi:hypothetical protein
MGKIGRRTAGDRPWLRLLAAGAVLSSATASGILLAAGAGAELPPAFVALAAANGGRVSFVVPGQFAVEEIVDGGGPVAQSKLDGLGGDSFAALPYPGGTAVAYQGLFAVATGVSSPFAYPAYVSASNPGTPAQEVNDPSGSGAYHLLATASPAEASGLARFRPGSEDAMTSGGEATTRIAASGSTVLATAGSLSEGIDAGKGTLRITSVRSHAKTTYTTGADQPVTETGLEVDGLRIGDVSFGVGSDGFVVLGQPVPYSAADVDALIGQLLAPSGVQVRFVKAQPIVGGAQAAALEVTTTSPPGPTGASGTLTLRLGGASSAISVGEGALPPTPLGAVEPLAPPPPAPAAPTFATGPDAAGLSPIRPVGGNPDQGGVGSRAGGSYATGGTTGGGLDEATLAAGATSTPPGATGLTGVTGSADLAARVVVPRRVSHIRSIYGFLGAAAALMFLVGMAWAGRGDRAWMPAEGPG